MTPTLRYKKKLLDFNKNVLCMFIMVGKLYFKVARINSLHFYITVCTILHEQTITLIY